MVHFACVARHDFDLGGSGARKGNNPFALHAMHQVDSTHWFARLFLLSQDEERPPPFQLFGCIQEGRRVVDAASA